MKVTYSIIIIMAKEQSTVTELRIEKTIYQSSSSKLMYEFAAANAVSFLLSCTPAVSTCSSKLSLLSTINFDFKKLLIIASYDKSVSYLDIHRPVSALYKMVVARVTLNLITRRSLKKIFSIIFTDNNISSIAWYESWHARILINITESINILNDKDQII